MNIITRSIYGADLQTSLLLGLPHVPQPNTTLNEKFDVLPAAEAEQNEHPRLRYMCIGNRGHRMMASDSGDSWSLPIHHRAEHAALYNHLPFVLREPDNDLSVVERERYALRTTIEIRGEQYIAYYLKRLDMSNIDRRLLYEYMNGDGQSGSEDFVPSDDALNPEPTDILENTTDNQVIASTGDYLTSSAIIDAGFRPKDVEELINVAEIMFENRYRAIVSEIGLVTGIDRVAQGDSPNGTFNYREAILTQIACHITGYHEVGSSNQGFDQQIEAGATESLLGDISD